MVEPYDDVERAFLYTDLVSLRESVSVTQTAYGFRECIEKCASLIEKLNTFDGEKQVFPGKLLLLRELKQRLQEIQQALEENGDKFATRKKECVDEALWSLDRVESDILVLLQVWMRM